jgi:hypothetical protein
MSDQAYNANAFNVDGLLSGNKTVSLTIHIPRYEITRGGLRVIDEVTQRVTAFSLQQLLGLGLAPVDLYMIVSHRAQLARIAQNFERLALWDALTTDAPTDAQAALSTAQTSLEQDMWGMPGVAPEDHRRRARDAGNVSLIDAALTYVTSDAVRRTMAHAARNVTFPFRNPNLPVEARAWVATAIELILNLFSVVAGVDGVHNERIKAISIDTTFQQLASKRVIKPNGAVGALREPI